MRPILRLLGTRYGIALILAVLVLGVVGLVRGFAGSYRQPLATAVESPRSSIDPTAGNDSVLTSESPTPPATSPGALGPAEVAADFVRAWLIDEGVTPEQWRAGIARYMTPDLRDKLKDTDPAGAPAERMTGPVVLQNRAATFVEASVPVDSGTVHLRLLSKNGRWFVDGVDWERA
jgi:hypothetical protein